MVVIYKNCDKKEETNQDEKNKQASDYCMYGVRASSIKPRFSSSREKRILFVTSNATFSAYILGF
jgi:hypothetical protein